MQVLKQLLGLDSRANVTSQNVIWSFRQKEENYRFKKIQLMTRKGSRYLLESNLLLPVGSQDKWSGEINWQNFDSSPELILATANAKTKAMTSHVLSWQRKSLLSAHLINQTLIWEKGSGGGNNTGKIVRK